MPHTRADNKFQVPDVINPPQKICVSMQIPDNEIHIQNFIGAVAGLTMARAYADKPGVKSVDIARVWRDAMSTLQFGNCDEKRTQCVDYDLSNQIISYFPQDPFTQPGYVPFGYIASPFYVVNGNILDLAQGYEIGDIICPVTALPGGINPFHPESFTFPRFRIQLEGPGYLKINFVKPINGGVAQIQTDGDILSLKYVNLYRDDLTLPPTDLLDITSEHETSVGAGKHFVDVTFLFSVTDTIPFLHFGGGIRSISICGQDTGVSSDQVGVSFLMASDFLTQVAMIDGKCKFQYKCCPEDPWITVAVEGDVPAPTTPPSGTPDPGSSQQYCFTLQASQPMQIGGIVSAGDTITIDSIDGHWLDDVFPWRCADDGSVYFVTCTRVSQGMLPGDPVPTQNHMTVILKLGSTYYGALVGIPFVVPSGISNSTIELQANDSTLADNSGTASVCVTVKNNAAIVWTHVSNFAVTPDQFAYDDDPIQPIAPTWTPGSGWVATSQAQTNPPNHTVTNNVVQRSLSGSFAITSVFLKFRTTETVGSGGRAIVYPDGHVSAIPDGIGDQTFTDNYISSVPGTLQFGVGTFNNDFSDTGTTIIEEAIITGTGTSPF